MEINSTGNIYYTDDETAILTGHNDMKRDELARELNPQIQRHADESGKPIDVYFADGTMDKQVQPRD